MNSKGHLIASLVKSILRIIGCYISFFYKSVEALAGFFLLAEMLGLVEELLDKR